MNILNMKMQNLRHDFDHEKCKRKQPGAPNNSTYTLAELRPMVRSFAPRHGLTWDEYDDMKTSKTKMCAWIKAKLGNRFRASPPRRPSPVQSPRRPSPVQSPRRPSPGPFRFRARPSPGRVQNLKNAYANEKAKACQKKSRSNPNPYTGKEWITILKEKYGYTDNDLAVSMHSKTRGLSIHQIYNLLDSGKLTLKQKNIFCDMLEERFGNGNAIPNNRKLKLKEFKDLHEARMCKKRSVKNPNPYTTGEILDVLKDYGFTERQIQNRLYVKFPFFRRFRISRSSELKLYHRKELCEMVKTYLTTGQRPLVAHAPGGALRLAPVVVRRNSPSPMSRQRITTFERTLPPNHPVFSASEEYKRTWLKLQLGMRLTSEEQRAQGQRSFDNLAERAMQFNLNRMMQQQMNEPEIRTVGLNDPGNNWRPSNGKNVNNVMNNAENMFTGNVPKNNRAVYLENNVRNRKIQAVYNQNALKRWLMQKKESPTTRKAIESWNSVKRVPEKIMRRYGSNVYWAIQDAKMLQELKKTKYLTRLINILEKGKTLQDCKKMNAVHVFNEQNYQNLRTSCATYMTMLKDYVMSKKTKKEQKGVLERFDKRSPACLENACSAINEFIQEDSNEFVFDFDPKLDKLTNMSNCANALRKSYCVMLKKKEINEKAFLKKMKGLVQAIFNITRNKIASDGKIGPEDVKTFVRDYGEMLLDCPDTKIRNNLFNNFYFEYMLIGAL